MAAPEECHPLAHLRHLKPPGVQRIVQIRGQVGNLVHQIDQLRFQRRKFAQKIFGQFGMRVGRVIARVFHDAFAHGERQIQPAKGRIALFEPRHDAQRMQIVVKAQSMCAQALVQRALAGMAKGRMPDVVRQAQRFGQLRIQPQRTGRGARNLRHLQRVGEPAARVVSRQLPRQAAEDLCLTRQAAKGSRMQNPCRVAGKRRAVRVRWLRMGPHRQRAIAFHGNGGR